MQDNEGGQELLSRQEELLSQEREPSLPAPMQWCWLVTAAYMPFSTLRTTAGRFSPLQNKDDSGRTGVRQEAER